MRCPLTLGWTARVTVKACVMLGYCGMCVDWIVREVAGGQQIELEVAEVVVVAS